MRSLAAFLLMAGTLLAQAPAVTGVHNTASLDNRLSPGCLAVIRGSNLGFGDADVTIGGQTAPVIFGTPGSMNVQIPFELSPGATTLTVALQGRSSAPFRVNLAAYSPGLSSFDYTGQ